MVDAQITAFDLGTRFHREFADVDLRALGDYPFDVIAALVNGSWSHRRLYHANQSPCWVPPDADPDGGVGALRPADPECDGLCWYQALHAYVLHEVEKRHKYHAPPLTPGLAYTRAPRLFSEVQRRQDQSAGRYVRLERLDPDTPAKFHDAKSGAPKWYRDALPDYRSRRRAYAMLRRVRTCDTAAGSPFPFEQWAGEDGVSVHGEMALVQWIIEQLRAAQPIPADDMPAFVEANLEGPLSRARWVGSDHAVDPVGAQGQLGWSDTPLPWEDGVEAADDVAA